MKKLIFLFLILHTAIFAITTDEVRKTKFTQEKLNDLVYDLVLQGKLEKLDKWKITYSANFDKLDFGEAYYKVGSIYYKRKFKNLALKAFLKGFGVFGSSPYKAKCAYMVSKIMYLQEKTETALYYVNRGIERNNNKNEKLQRALFKLKRKIRWNYISRFDGLPDDSVADIEFDGDDVWIAMWTGGIARYTRSANKMTIFKPRKNGLISPHVRDMVITKRYVWVGTYEGLCRYDKKTGRWKRIKNKLGYTTVKRIVLIDGYLYIATLGKGLYYLKPGTENNWIKFFSGSRYITDVIKVGSKLYISTLDKGIYLYENGSFKQLLHGNAVKALAYLKGNLWVGTYGGGVILIDTETQKMVKNIRKKKNGLSSDYIESLCPIKDKMIIGTLGGGVNIYHSKDETIAHINLLDGLPSPDVVRIAIEKQWIWFGTLSGGMGILITESFDDI